MFGIKKKKKILKIKHFLGRLRDMSERVRVSNILDIAMPPKIECPCFKAQINIDTNHSLKTKALNRTRPITQLGPCGDSRYQAGQNSKP